jgi:hypothetical protein
LLPETDKVENFVILFFLSQIRITIAKDPGSCILGHKSQNALLTTTAFGDILFFHQDIFPMKRDGVEIQVKGYALLKA